MMQYTIRPLQNLLKDRTRNYVKLGDLEQLIQKIEKVQQQQLTQGINVPEATQEYLKILKKLTKALSPGQKLLKTDLADQVDKYIRQNELHFWTARHSALSGNTFFAPEGRYRFYDLALYNENANPDRVSHHEKWEARSVCYARFEHQGSRVLIGNLQIDDLDTEEWPWGSARHEQILSQRKNLYLNLVQEAILEALGRGKTEIMFQAGAAALLAQDKEPEDVCQKVVMTGKNYDYYHDKYQEALKNFSAATAGAPTVVPDPKLGQGIVIKKTATYYQAVFHPIEHVEDGRTFFEIVDDKMNKARKYISGGYSKVVWQIRQDFYARKSVEMLEGIERSFRIALPGHAATQKTQKLKYLTELINQAPRAEKEYIGKFREIIDKFLIKFNYHEKYLAQNPDIRSIRLAPSFAQKYPKSNLRFYDIDRVELIETFRPTQLIAPKRGKTYIIAKKNLTRPLERKNDQAAGLEGIFSFSEKTLPEILTQLGLSYKPVKIHSRRAGRPKSAYAWLITEGLEELRRTPRASFATGPKLKTDCVTLSQLERVVKKFGLAPEQLKITNDWICAGGTPRLGQYTPATDEITLSTPSVALAAHEGLHRLVAQGLVPPREYQSLVAAGRGWAKAHPKTAVRRLPAEPARPAVPGEEYAALFVEKYYEQEGLARKYLLGAKVPVFARLVGYIKEVRDIIGAAAGHSPAIARNFLRRVERNRVLQANNENAPPVKFRGNNNFYGRRRPRGENFAAQGI